MTEILNERDLRELMAVIEEGRRDDPTEGLPWAVLDGLIKLIRCDYIASPEADLVHDRGVVTQWLRDGGERGLQLGDAHIPGAVFWGHFKNFAPYSYPQRAGDLTSVIRWSDFHTTPQLRNASLYAEYFHHEGVRHSVHVSLPISLPGGMRIICFFRGKGADFTERDRLVLQVLRPHLYEVYLDAQRRRQRIPSLSVREWEVLQLAHRGFSNSDIARELFISVATVRKHLEHIFDRTGARTRTAAAALMMPHFMATRTDRRQK